MELQLLCSLFIVAIHCKETLFNDFAYDSQANQYFHEQFSDLVHLESRENDIDNWGALYENANDEYDDEFDISDQSQIYANEEDVHYNEYDEYDDIDNMETDAMYEKYKNMHWMDEYFDELDEFYYNNYRLHTAYNDFEDIDFSQFLHDEADTDDTDTKDMTDVPHSIKLKSETHRIHTIQYKPDQQTGETFTDGDDIIGVAAKNHMVIGMILRSYMMYLRTAAHLQGKIANNGPGLKPLPSDLQKLCKGDFGALDVSQIRVAMGVNTLHGHSVTFGYDIFIPRMLDIKHMKSDLEILLKQIKYVQMYTHEGGVWPFLEKHVMNVCKDMNVCAILKKIVQQRSLNVMEAVKLDKKTQTELKSELAKIWQQYGTLPGALHTKDV